MNFYPFHIGDYISHTNHLSDAEDLAYRRMIDLYYQTETGFSCLNAVARRVRASVDVVETIAKEFFVFVDGVYRHTRCDSEIAKYHSKAESARNANGRRWDKKSDLKTDLKSDLKSYLKSDADQILTKNQEPRTINQEPEINKKARSPEGDLLSDIEPQLAKDFRAMRAKLKAPITQTAIAGIKREASKAGLSLEDALRVCCERNWRGFKAEWVQNLSRPAYESEKDKSRREAFEILTGKKSNEPFTIDI